MTIPALPLSWRIQFPLLTNPNIVRAWLKAMAATYLLSLVIVIPVFIAIGEASAVPMLLVIFGAAVAGLALLGFAIMFLVLGNRSHARFTLSEKQVMYESIDTKARTLSRMAVLAGGFFGEPAGAGAGILSISNEAVSVAWKDVAKARYDDKNHTICLRSRYRELLHIYCDKKNYDQAAQVVKNMLASEKPEKKAPKRSKNKK